MPNKLNATNPITIAQVLSILPAPQNGKYLCPACDQWHLTVKEADRKVLVHCFTPECTNAWETLTQRLGSVKLPKPYEPPSGKGLTVAQYAEGKRIPAQWLMATFGLRDSKYQGVPCVEFPYWQNRYDEGSVKRRWGMSGKERRWKPGNKATLYGVLQMSLSEMSDTESIFIVEGESNTQTLVYLDYPTLGVSGAEGWKDEYANHPLLAGKTIYVCQDPDDAGAAFVQKVANSFPRGRVRAIKLPVKDVSDLWIQICEENGWLESPAIVDRTKRPPIVKEPATNICSTRFGEAFEEAISAAQVVESQAKRIKSVLASDVEMDLTTWLWFERIPVGELTVFAGMPQKGKSTAAIDVAARLTTGRDFPGSVKQVDACEVAILASEDNLSKTVKPRIVAAKADATRIHLITGTGDGAQEWEVSLDNDRELLREFLQEHPNVKLIIIDPVTSYIGEVDPNKPKEVRPFLNKLKKFAEEMGVSFLLIMHLSKNPDVSALHRVGGAATWIEVPRSVWFFDEKHREEGDENPTSYVMVNGKLNIVADDRKRSMEYTFASVDVVIRGITQSKGVIHWGDEVSVTLEQQYNRTRDKRGPAPKAREAAKLWLREYLADGPRPVEGPDGIKAAAMKAGHNEWTLRDAKTELGLGHQKHQGRYVWLLPAVEVGIDIG